MSFKQTAAHPDLPYDPDTSPNQSKPQDSDFQLESDPEEDPSTMRCLTDRQRQLLIAVFGTFLSALMTVCLVYLLNQIRG